MKCPKCKFEIKEVLYYGYDANKKLYLKGTCYFKGNKPDVMKFMETPAIRSNSEFVCPKCMRIITKLLDWEEQMKKAIGNK